MNNKKILFIDTTLHKKDATGITLSNLFGMWPRDNLYMIGDNSSAILSKNEGYSNVFTTDHNDYYHRYPLGLGLKIYRKISHKRNTRRRKNSVRTSIAKDQSHPILKNNLFSILYKIFIWLGFDYLFFRRIISQRLRDWISEIKPDYLYAVLSTRHSILFAKNLQNEFKIPLIIHIMDDWPTTLVKPGLFAKYWQKKINKEFQDLLNISSKKIAISEKMAIDYMRRYNCDWLYFHNPVDISFWRNGVDKNYVASNPFTVVYSGRVSFGVDKTLELFATCVDELINDENMDLRLQIQTNTQLKSKSKYRSVDISGYIEYEKLPIIFSKADLLIIPYDFDGNSYDFIKYSMPTKATEYMISGTPILIIAPKSTAIAEYANAYKWAYVISDNSKDAIKKGLKFMINSQNAREEYGKNAVNMALKYHEIKIVQYEFNNIFKH